ncbi:MAG: hypothetical protein DI586_00100 [Micavibrio aeruginosavorus]|uniref:DUF218 domain-containing protein n=1 Tax=Micavibrio aeruginosavorus TaxID=349221 RepID=A0A2W5FND2_9BACT|nr:MAG: hypothetical protein DI586_00100 [Micavibrio aeruginosavorus]
MKLCSPVSFLRKHHILLQTDLCRADLGIVFGNKYIVQELAVDAARLYHKGFFPKILVTGGVETAAGCCEAEATAHALLSLGVKREDILLESASTHTGENVAFSLPLIDTHIGLENIHSVIGFGHFCAGPRFLMTLARHCPDLHAMHKSVFPAGCNETNWHLDPVLLERAMLERRKIPDYIAAGFIAPVSIPAINEKTASLRHHQLYAPPYPKLNSSGLDRTPLPF